MLIFKIMTAFKTDNRFWRELKAQGYRVAVLQASASQSLFDYQLGGSMVCVLGGESEGVGADVLAMADTELSVPMANGVESLNVAVTASLAAFHLRRPAS